MPGLRHSGRSTKLLTYDRFKEVGEMSGRVISVVLLLVMTLLCMGKGYADEGTIREKLSHPHRDGELIVKYRDGRVGSAGIAGFHERHGTRSLKKFKGVDLEHIRVPQGDDLAKVMRDMENDPDVAYVEPNYIVKALVTPSDTYFSSLWGMTKIAAPAAWDVTTGNSGVVIAVIDTGVDATHPDLTANIWPGIGYNSLTGTNSPTDDHGHGTHVSGIIGAVGNNALGVTGVNWGVRIVSCKFLDAGGNGTIADAIECLAYVRNLKDSGLNIVATNNSWGGDAYSQAMYDAISAQRDILFVAAAGNSGANNDIKPMYPANYNHPLVLSIAATSYSDELASFSEFGRRTVHIGAPGRSIMSTTKGGDYGAMSGTSMATPHVAGLAGLISAGKPALDWKGIKNTLLSSGDPVAYLANKSITGRRINAYSAVTCTDSGLFSALVFPSTPVVGTPSILSALSVNCSNPVGPVTVGLLGGEVINLADDGVTPDVAANDGIFTGYYVPVRTHETFSFSSPAGSETIAVPLPAPLNIEALLFPAGTTGVAYSVTVTASGGSSPYAWSLFDGTLPAGLSLNTGTGVVIGIPTTAETRSFSIKVTDSTGMTDIRLFSITIKPPLVITTTSFPSATVGVPYSFTLSATGGTPPYVWAWLLDFPAPPGLTLSTTGVLSGTPTAEGTWNLSITVQDANFVGKWSIIPITVFVNIPTITTTALYSGMAGLAYSQTLSVVGGKAPYLWSLASGNLPAGLVLSADGVISGMPTMAETPNFTVQVTDGAGVTATKVLSILINPAGRVNVALPAFGGVATASSTYNATSYPAAAVNNGDRKGTSWGAGGGWNDGTNGVFPDWVQITFAGQQTIDEIDIFTLQDVFTAPVEPTATMTFSKYGITTFDVQYWNGSAWVTVPGGSISGNNLVRRQIMSQAVTTDRIRVLVNAALGGYSRITEIEVYNAVSSGDHVPPTVTLTAPASGATYTAPATISLTATASDPDGTISKVEFYNGAVLLGTAATAPYSYSWSNVAAGTYTLTAKAYDNLNVATTSTAVSVTVSTLANVPPTVTLTAPANGATYTAPAAIILTATAADSDGTVSKVEFYNGATLLGTATTAPYSFTWTGVVAGAYTLTAKAFDNAGSVTTATAATVTVSVAATRINVALAANGGVASASSTISASYAVTSVNDGDRLGKKWGVTAAGGGWNDATNNVFPDWAQITFNGQKTIDEIDVITLQDAYATAIAPTATLVFTKYGITAFDVQYWNGTAWVTVTGGSITGNNLAWRKIVLATPVTTDRIRVLVNAGVVGTYNYSRIVEIEAYTPSGGVVNNPPTVTLTAPTTGATYTAPATIDLTAAASDSDGTVTKVEFYSGATLLGTATTAPYSFTWTGVVAGYYTLSAKAYDNAGAVTTATAATVTVSGSAARINVALATNGGVATASSTYSASYAVTSVNDGDRLGKKWGVTVTGGGWNDATNNVFPDWAQITFNGQKTIDEIDVITLQDVYATAIDPTATLAFTKYGITAFDVQYWNGTAWVTVTGGRITGNNLVWRKIVLATPVTTDRIRVLVNAGVVGTYNYSRIVEIEAYTPSGGDVNNPPTVTLTAPTTGATHTAPATIDLTAAASDPDGTVSQVEFYNGATLLGTASTTPYTFSWTNVAVGTYTLTAKVYDNLGVTTTSAAVVVNVTALTQYLTCESIKTGLWSDATTWGYQCNGSTNIPRDSDRVIIASGTTVTINDNRTIGATTVGTAASGKVATLVLGEGTTTILAGALLLTNGTNMTSVLTQERNSTLTAGAFPIHLGATHAGTGTWRWNIYGDATGRVTNTSSSYINATANIITTGSINWNYATFSGFDSAANTEINARLGALVNHCLFVGTSGKYTFNIGSYNNSSIILAAINLDIINSYFRNIHVSFGADKQTTETGRRNIKNNTFYGLSSRELYLRVNTGVGNYILDGNIIYNIQVTEPLATNNTFTKGLMYSDTNFGSSKVQYAVGTNNKFEKSVILGEWPNTHSLISSTGTHGTLYAVDNYIDYEGTANGPNFVLPSKNANYYVQRNIATLGNGNRLVEAANYGTATTSTIDISNNTIITGLLWFSESSCWLGVGLAYNNIVLHVDRNSGFGAINGDEPPAGPCEANQFDWIDYNNMLPTGGKSAYKNLTITAANEYDGIAKSIGDSGFGGNDKSVDPQFLQPTANTLSYSGTETRSAFVLDLLRMNGFDETGAVATRLYPDKSVAGLLAYMLESYTPHNPALLGRGFNGENIGVIVR